MCLEWLNHVASTYTYLCLWSLLRMEMKIAEYKFEFGSVLHSRMVSEDLDYSALIKLIPFVILLHFWCI